MIRLAAYPKSSKLLTQDLIIKGGPQLSTTISSLGIGKCCSIMLLVTYPTPSVHVGGALSKVK